MPGLVRPHGGRSLKPLMPAGGQLAAERARAGSLPGIRVSSREKGDLIMLGIGGFTPLEGFMSHADWQGVCDGYRTSGGLFWPIPITLSTDSATAATFKTGMEVALLDPESGEPLAILKVTEKYAINKAHECATVFGTTDPAHPGVKMVMAQGDVNLAGPVKVLSDGGFKAKYGSLFMTPAETRAEFERLGWSRVAAFQSCSTGLGCRRTPTNGSVPSPRACCSGSGWHRRCSTIRTWCSSTSRPPAWIRSGAGGCGT